MTGHTIESERTQALLPTSDALAPDRMQVHEQPRAAWRRWEDTIPWFLTVASVLTLGAIAWLLVENILWFRATAFDGLDRGLINYRLHLHHLHLAMIKRSVGLFSGFALMFLGTAVAFYSLKTTPKVRLEGLGTKAAIASASPGIIAMALGVVLLLGTISSKDDFGAYPGEPASSPAPRVIVPPLPDATR